MSIYIYWYSFNIHSIVFFSENSPLEGWDSDEEADATLSALKGTIPFIFLKYSLCIDIVNAFFNYLKYSGVVWSDFWNKLIETKNSHWIPFWNRFSLENFIILTVSISFAYLCDSWSKYIIMRVFLLWARQGRLNWQCSLSVKGALE